MCAYLFLAEARVSKSLKAQIISRRYDSYIFNFAVCDLRSVSFLAWDVNIFLTIKSERCWY